MLLNRFFNPGQTASWTDALVFLQTFTNEVKFIPGVGSYAIFATGGFPVRCTSKNQWSPRIEKLHLTDGTLTSEPTKYMCAGFYILFYQFADFSPPLPSPRKSRCDISSLVYRYCFAVGCPSIQSKTHIVKYGGGMLTSERYSPPILPSRTNSPINVSS